jgi:hypothetical protein
MPPSADKAARGASPVLLVLAALCFLLPFVGVSCNGSALQGLASSLPGASDGAQASACLSTISNTDLYTYSGLNLATGSAPSTVTIPSSCSSTTGGSSTSSDTPTVGVQPLLVLALVLIVVGIVATVLRPRLRYVVGAASALVAAILVIAGNSAVHGAVSDRISALASRSGDTSGLSLQGLGGVGSFFNIHAAIGFTLILVALFLALAANAVGLVAASGLHMSRASPAGRVPPTAEPPWRPDTEPSGERPPPPPPPSG